VLHEQENALLREHSHKTNRNVCDLFCELMGRHILPRDRQLIRLPLPEHLKKDQEYKDVWVLQATEVLKAINKNLWMRRSQKARLLRGMQSLMRKWIAG
jgi:hypothetical protein